MLSNFQAVFGHFQNLNLLALLQNLREGRTARQAWLSGSLLCPVAHGMPQGEQMLQLRALGQTAELRVGCNFAAGHLSADPEAVLQFVRCWDEDLLSSGSLLHLLEELWEERLADAEVVQAVLQEGPARPRTEAERADEPASFRSSISVGRQLAPSLGEPSRR